MANPPAPSGDFLSKKVGPLPTWAWGLIVLGLALAYSLYKSHKASATASTTSSTDQTGTSTGSQTVPEYIAQNYITNNEPAAGPTSTTPTAPTTPTTPTSPTPPVQKPNPPTAPTPPTTSNPVKKTPPPTAKPISVKVTKGETLSSIAAKYGTTWQAIWAYNTSAASGRPASTIATLKKRGPNLLEVGEEILIPPKS
jgi:LysM repeat protein